MLGIDEACIKLLRAKPENTITSIIETKDAYIFNNPPLGVPMALDSMRSVNKNTGEVKPFMANPVGMSYIDKNLVKQFSKQEVNKYRKEYFE